MTRDFYWRKCEGPHSATPDFSVHHEIMSVNFNMSIVLFLRDVMTRLACTYERTTISTYKNGPPRGYSKIPKQGQKFQESRRRNPESEKNSLAVIASNFCLMYCVPGTRGGIFMAFG